MSVKLLYRHVRRRENNPIYRIPFYCIFNNKFFKKEAIFPKNYQFIMLVYAKLLHNGAEGAILENFTLKFEYCNDFASFFCFWPKKFPGGAEVPGGGEGAQ